MSNDDYLRDALRAQEVQPDGKEMRELQAARADIEALIRKHFEACAPTIRYGGSKAKGTMNLEDYDLDVIVYFPRTATAAGSTIKTIGLSFFKKLRIAIPPVIEQGVGSNAVLAVERRVFGMTVELEKYKAQKTGLMQDLLTGKVRVKVDEAEEVAP